MGGVEAEEGRGEGAHHGTLLPTSKWDFSDCVLAASKKNLKS